MPIYEYRCTDCDENFEIVQSIRDHDRKRPAHCPMCGGTRTERRFSRVAVETGSKGYHPAKPLDV